MAEGVRYQLSLWHKSPSLPLLESSPSSPHVIIFVPGLTDTFGTVPYLDKLARAIEPIGFSLIQVQLSSSLGGFGVSSLEADAQELTLVIQHLRTRSFAPKSHNGKIILMGHSTGCQDIAHFFSIVERQTELILVHGAILQAPVSDREYFEQENKKGSDVYERLQEATRLFKEGKGGTILSRKLLPPQPGEGSDRPQVYSEAYEDPPMTAYRFWSLNGRGGHDDYFSSDLDEEKVISTWTAMTKGGRKIAALLGEKDEFYPANVAPESLADRWNDIIRTKQQQTSFLAQVVQGASHKVEDANAQANLVRIVTSLAQDVVEDSPKPTSSSSLATNSHLSANAAAKANLDTNSSVDDAPFSTSHEQGEKYPPSFDEVVELISTGRAENIPGVRNIPLKINEAQPSEPTMQRPLKPWEREESRNESSLQR